jgi:hypothetical protein
VDIDDMLDSTLLDPEVRITVAEVARMTRERLLAHVVMLS